MARPLKYSVPIMVKVKPETFELLQAIVKTSGLKTAVLARVAIERYVDEGKSNKGGKSEQATK